jgi:hypothetical protein
MIAGILAILQLPKLGFDVAIQLDDIVEIARPRPSGQGAKFLREGFDIVVGYHLGRRPACWCTDALKFNAVSKCS